MIRKNRVLKVENSQEVVATRYGRKPSSIRMHPSNTSLTKLPKKIRFGSSIISVQQPNKTSAKRNIAAGQSALARAMRKMIKPGVVIESKRSPIYYADSQLKGIIIREHNGDFQKGIFKNGKFKKCP